VLVFNKKITNQFDYSIFPSLNDIQKTNIFLWWQRLHANYLKCAALSYRNFKIADGLIEGIKCSLCRKSIIRLLHGARKY
jgi:hypothetical protein